jgi:hypothetical protein
MNNFIFSQLNYFYVKPIQTDSNYISLQDSHLVITNNTIHLNKLFFFIGGTGSKTKSYFSISAYAASLGYDVINIAYPNDTAAQSVTNSSDSLAFNKFRQEVCFGTPISPDVSVDSLNCIYTRFIKLLNYLIVNHPSQNWSQYMLNPSTPDWSKIVVGGHSQGSGHACYFAKLNMVDRVLMFSGPNDYSNYYSNSANWLRTPGFTPVNRHFAYLNLLDEIVPFSEQFINLKGLGLYPLYDTTFVDNSNPPYNNSHFLYTQQTPGLAVLYHNTTTKLSIINDSVWKYMLTSPIPTNVNEIMIDKKFSVYPNPTINSITINSTNSFNPVSCKITNLIGETIFEENLNTFPVSIDLSIFPSGFYFIHLNNEVEKIIKE